MFNFLRSLLFDRRHADPEKTATLMPAFDRRGGLLSARRNAAEAEQRVLDAMETLTRTVTRINEKHKGNTK